MGTLNSDKPYNIASQVNSLIKSGTKPSQDIILGTISEVNNNASIISQNIEKDIIPFTSSGLSHEFDSYLIPVDDLWEGDFRLLETDEEIRVPQNTAISIMVTSNDVLHSFAIPSLGVKIDACPGRINQTNIIVNRPGIYNGQCSEICGTGHGFMPINVFVMPFTEWYNLFSTLGINKVS